MRDPGLYFRSFSVPSPAASCGLVGLCYTEFATLIAVSGSAYTYAYASLVEFAAWVIGWDLILEYATFGATVRRLTQHADDWGMMST